MQRMMMLATATGTSALLSYATLTAAASTSINAMPDKGVVTVSGVVEKVKNDMEFTLRDNSGKIGIRVPAQKNVVLNEGDSVSVTGTVMWNDAGKDVKAYRIKIVQRNDV